MREKEGRDGVSDRNELGRWRAPPGNRCVAGGAKKSEREPVASRARVEVNATVVTCVDGRPAGGEALRA